MAIDIFEWLDMMADTVSINAFVSRTVSGKPIYNMSVTKTYQCYVRMMNHKVVDKHGDEVMARGFVIIATTDVIGIDDLITLPSDYIPVNPPIQAVDLVPDESGTHHVTVHIG